MNSIFQLRNVNFVLGESPVMNQTYQLMLKAARSDLPIMITGETGVGKEVVAGFIHYQSSRKNNPFVKINCPALSPQLIESEFFGYEKGAFTGAETTHLGRLELANQGTLLMNEINEIDLRQQAKLLQVIEDKCFERVGSSFPQKIDVRFIATCNQNIKDLVEAGKLRTDLYYRLNVIPIHIPPLRERKEDIMPLIKSFFERISNGHTVTIESLHEETIKTLLNYSWPGNIRELFNFLQRIVSLIDIEDCILPEHVLGLLDKNPFCNHNKDAFTGLLLSDVEKETIQSTLSNCGGNQQKAAQYLGISNRTLRNKIKQYSINNE